MRKELIDHKAEAFQNRSLYGDAIACLYIFLLFDSLLCHVVASDFERIIAVLFLQLYLQQKRALLALHAVSLDPQRKVLLRFSDQLERLLRIAWFLAAALRTDIKLVFFSFQQREHELSIANCLILNNVAFKIQNTQFESLPCDLAAHIDVVVIFCRDCERNNNEMVPEAGKRNMPYWEFHLIDNENGLEVMDQILIPFYAFALAQVADLAGCSFLLNAVHMNSFLPFWLQLRQSRKHFVHANQLNTLSDRVLLAWVREESMQSQREVYMLSLEQSHQKQPAYIDEFLALLASCNHQGNLLLLQWFLGKVNFFILSSFKMPSIEVISFAFRSLDFKQTICQVFSIQILDQLSQPLWNIFGLLFIKAIRNVSASKSLKKRRVKLSCFSDMDSLHECILSFEADSGKQVDMVANVPHKFLILRRRISLKDAKHL